MRARVCVSARGASSSLNKAVRVEFYLAYRCDAFEKPCCFAIPLLVCGSLCKCNTIVVLIIVIRCCVMDRTDVECVRGIARAV